ncbi:TPA: helicase [Candidatus Taylorbacteria bacterium]|nr:helicase [Candidatus Taylorbacteria bacterium]
MTQKDALEILKLGHNVYLTGSAGSGKTYLLNQYIDYLKKNKIEVAVTASTGIAATHMNGITIHSWSGLGIRDVLTEESMLELEERRYLWDRIHKTKVLIIDEVSMLHHFRLDLVDMLTRRFKRDERPFGGMQVVLCGDFFQLPPVSRQGEREAHFVYHSDAWKALDPTICYLHEQHRQTDENHVAILNEIRKNDVTEGTYELLQSRFNKDPDNSAEPTRLYTHNVDVDTINTKALGEIGEESRIFEMRSSGRPPLVESLKKSCLAPENLHLKIGARVMFVKNNFEGKYVNGTLGKVIDFEMDAPIVLTTKGDRIKAVPMSWSIEENGKVKAEISQVPLRLAWAITVHKSQGMSLDAVEVDLSKSFERGMGYVALSRVRTLGGLKLLGINSMALQVHEEVLEFDQELQTFSDTAVDALHDMKKETKERIQKEFVSKNVVKEKQADQKVSTYDETKKLLAEKPSLAEMAKKRGMTIGTILSHLETLCDENKIEACRELTYLKPEIKRFNKMQSAFEKVLAKTGEMKLSAARDILGRSFDFEEIRICRLFVKK